MNVDDAITAHLHWKKRLEDYINGDHTTLLYSNQVRNCSICDLGMWIQGEGRKYKHLPSFVCLLLKHATFHAWAADIVDLVLHGETDRAKWMLKGPFSKISEEVIGCLKQLKEENL